MSDELIPDLTNDAPTSLGAQLMAEIKAVSGLSHSELASALNAHIDLSDKMIGNYLAGTKHMSYDRLFSLAKAADGNGWTGKTIDWVLSLSTVCSADYIREFNQLALQERKLKKRDKQTAVRNLEKVVAALIEAGMSDTDIVTLSVLFTEKLIPPYARHSGGLVELASLRKLAGLDSNGYPSAAWSAWQVKCADAAADE